MIDLVEPKHTKYKHDKKIQLRQKQHEKHHNLKRWNYKQDEVDFVYNIAEQKAN